MTNEERAESAFRVVHSMNHWGQNDPETDLGDFIGNLRHLCDEQGWDWGLILEKADYHYLAEKSEEAEEAQCEGHPAGPHDPMGQTVYCDGTCR